VPFQFTGRASKAILASSCAAPHYLAAIFALSAQPQTRCGKERWAIKTGTDAAPPQIDLSTPTPATIAELVALPSPSPIPVDQRVGSAETTTWVVNGTLTSFKLEDGPTGKSDYHLVIADDHELR
jgi:hypothetical protein